MTSKGRTFVVQPRRIRVIKEGKPAGGGEGGPVVYWMFTDQRLRDNRALILAVDQANLRNILMHGFMRSVYMNYAGCKRKCDADGYISYVKRFIGEAKQRKSRTNVVRLNGEEKKPRD